MTAGPSVFCVSDTLSGRMKRSRTLPVTACYSPAKPSHSSSPGPTGLLRDG